MKSNLKKLLLYALMIFPVFGIAQSTEHISGTIRDKNTGTSLPGVNVMVKGKNVGVLTDDQGRYEISVSPGATLTFHAIGYLNSEVKIAAGRTIDISLEPAASNLDQVVVVGYGTQKKADLTGSVVSANIEAFREVPNVSILQSLQGSVPGLNVGAVNAAGVDPTISIRGQITLSGSTSPLIVLDGIIYYGTMASLNPQDIASIDVLKDASAAAVYGSQAANGVVLVTSKRGKNTGKPVINFVTSYATQDPAHELHPMNRSQFVQKIKNVEWSQAYLGPDYTQPNTAFDLTQMLDAGQRLGYNQGTDYDWWKSSTDAGYIAENQLSISGATDKTNYYISGGYSKQKGFVLNDRFARKSVRINLETKVFSWLTLGAQTFGSFGDYSGVSPDLSASFATSPLVTPYDSTGALVPYPNGAATNPFLQSYGTDYDHRNSLLGNFYGLLNVPFIKGLSYRINYGNNYSWNKRFYANKFAGGLTGSAQKGDESEYDYTLDNIVSYKRDFSADHHVDVTLVYGASQRNYENDLALGNGFSNLGLGYNSLQQASIQLISSDAWQESANYQLARVNYGFKNKYLLTASVRRDGFSGFAENYKYGLFPSVAAGWVATNESFIHAKWLDYLKVRASYGSSGNLISRYSSLAKVTPGPAYVFGDTGPTLFGQEVTTLANPNLKWETTTGVNIGADFTILKSRISGSIDYYSTVTKNLLYTVNIPTITGFSSITTNVGQIDNHGIEIALNSTNIKSRDFQWTTTLNFSSNTNKIVQLLGTGDLVSSGLFIGRSVGAVYGYKITGLYQIGETPPPGWYTGTEKIADNNKDGNITPDDRVILGKTEPAYRVSLQNTFTYKAFSLMLFFNSVQGGKNGYLGQNNPWNGSNASSDNTIRSNWAREVNYWTPANHNAEYRVPGQIPAIDPAIYKDRSFIRLQDVTFSYHVPDRMLNRIGLAALTLYASGNNLVTWTKWKGWDPETGEGLIYGGMPVLRGFNLGLNVSF